MAKWIKKINGITGKSRRGLLLLLVSLVVSISGCDALKEIADAMDITLQKKNVTLELGKTTELKIDVANAEDTALIWEIDDPAIVSVEELDDLTFEITGLKVGHTEIDFTLLARKTISATFEVDVIPAGVLTIRLDRTRLTLKTGDTREMNWRLEPEGTSAKLKWTSSNPAIGTVNQSGAIEAKSAGHTDVVAWVHDNPNVRATVNVSVYDSLVIPRALQNIGVVPQDRSLRVNWVISEDAILDSVAVECAGKRYVVSQNVTTLKLEGLDNGTTYTIALYTILEGELTSTRYEVQAIPRDDTSPDALDKFVVEISGTQALLTWLDPVDDDLKSVEIYWQETGERFSVQPGVEEYTLTGLAYDRPYSAQAVAVDVNGNRSGPKFVNFVLKKPYEVGTTALTVLCEKDGWDYPGQESFDIKNNTAEDATYTISYDEEQLYFLYLNNPSGVLPAAGEVAIVVSATLWQPDLQFQDTLTVTVTDSQNNAQVIEVPLSVISEVDPDAFDVQIPVELSIQCLASNDYTALFNMTLSNAGELLNYTLTNELGLVFDFENGILDGETVISGEVTSQESQSGTLTLELFNDNGDYQMLNIPVTILVD